MLRLHSIRNCSFRCCAMAVLMALVWVSARAQTYPTKPVRMIVGSAAGGPIDAVARITAQRLGEAMGQSFVVENRTGAGGTIGTETAARAVPDGYTLLMGSAATLCITPSLYPKIPYDPVKDFAPISTVATTSFVLVVHPSVPATSLKQFIALGRARPGQLRFGSAGSGSVTHLSAELFRSMAGIDAVHVPYKGGSIAIIDVLSGQLDFMFDSVPNSVQHVRAGKLRALGVTGARRSPLMPELPTIAEAGVPGYEVSTWFGLLAPAATSREIIARLNTVLAKSLSSEDLKQRLLAQGFEPTGNTPEQFSQLIRVELSKWAKVVTTAGAKVD